MYTGDKEISKYIYILPLQESQWTQKSRGKIIFLPYNFKFKNSVIAYVVSVFWNLEVKLISLDFTLSFLVSGIGIIKPYSPSI